MKKLNLKSNCHCEEHSATRQSHEIASHSFAMTEETGRSMVEMLGVLAVIGVLSVAGIAGYSNAMNKHRANELLNEASKRATVVAMQATAGQNLSIDEFSATNEKLGFRGVQENPANTQQFQLTLSGVDEKVCAQMRTSVGTNTPIRDINNDCSIITYNKDLSTTVFASDFASESECRGGGKTWCSGLNGGNGTCSDNTDCCANVSLTQCQKNCNSATGAITPMPDGTLCDYSDGNDGQCNNGKCEQIPDDPCLNVNCPEPQTCNSETGECICPNDLTKDGDACICSDYYSNVCGPGFYCDFGGNFSDCTDTSALTGICTKVTGIDYTPARYAFSTDTMDWWSANSWCAGLGSELLNSDDLYEISGDYVGCSYWEGFYDNYSGGPGPLYQGICGEGSTCNFGHYLHVACGDYGTYLSATSDGEQTGGSDCGTTWMAGALCRKTN